MNELNMWHEYVNTIVTVPRRKKGGLIMMLKGRLFYLFFTFASDL
jgi:hypothetical protein